MTFFIHLIEQPVKELLHTLPLMSVQQAELTEMLLIRSEQSQWCRTHICVYRRLLATHCLQQPSDVVSWCVGA